MLQIQNSKDINSRIKNIFKNTSKTFNAICQKFKMKFKVSKLPEGRIIGLCTLQADLGRPKVHPKFTSRDMSVIHRLLIAAAWKRKQKDVKMQCSRKKEERRNGGGRDGGMKKRRRDMEKESEQEEAKREGKEEP